MEAPQYVNDVLNKRGSAQGQLTAEDCLSMSRSMPTANIPHECDFILKSAMKSGAISKFSSQARTWHVGNGHGVRSFYFAESGVDTPDNNKTVDDEFLTGKSSKHQEKVKALRTRMSMRGALNVTGVDEKDVEKERHFNGPLAVFTTVLLVLNESSTIINMVSRTYLLQDALLDTFDGTLVARDSEQIVREGRQLQPGSDPMQKLGKVLKSPFQKFTPKALIRYVMYLPLNFIPVVGTIAFILIQARARGKTVHDRYFQLKKWSNPQRSDWLKKHTGPYTAFGLVATALELIPFASMIFSFTNTVGAALWAADIEKKNTSMTDSTAPTLRETAKKAE